MSNQGTGAVMECGDIKIDLLGSRVSLKGKTLELTAAEYRLICLLVKNANRIITRDIILDELWDSWGDYVDNNTLSVYVRRLREKSRNRPVTPRTFTNSPRIWLSVERGGRMNFLHDKHTRYYCVFIVTLVFFCFLMGIALINTQTAATKEIFLIHNNAIATSLLEDGVPKEVIATALMNTEADSTGSKSF